MKKTFLLFNTLSCFISLTSHLLASEDITNCQDFNCSQTSVKIAIDRSFSVSNNYYSQPAYGALTETKWKAIAKRYYQSRLRTKFNSHNNLLNLWDVKELIGFSGIKIRESQEGNRQYWVWIDRHNPQRKIQATFNYYQLVNLKGIEFESEAKDFIKAESNRINSQAQ